MAQTGYPAGGDRMWWWRVAHQLDLAHIALANARAYNVDDPKLVHALETKIRETRAVLFEVFKGKGMLPPDITAPQAAPQAPASVPVAASPRPPMSAPVAPTPPPVASPTPLPPIVAATAPSAATPITAPEVPLAAAEPSAPLAPVVPDETIAATVSPPATSEAANGTHAAVDAAPPAQDVADPAQKKGKKDKDKKGKNGTAPHAGDDRKAHTNGTTETATSVAVTEAPTAAHTTEETGE